MCAEQHKRTLSEAIIWRNHEELRHPCLIKLHKEFESPTPSSAMNYVKWP